MEKIKKRKSEEQALRQSAVKLVYQTLDKKKHLINPVKEQAGLLREMEIIFRYYDMEMPEIPQELVKPEYLTYY